MYRQEKINRSLLPLCTCLLGILAFVFISPVISSENSAYADSHACACEGKENCECDSGECKGHDCSHACEKCGEKKCACGKSEQASSDSAKSEKESCH